MGRKPLLLIGLAIVRFYEFGIMFGGSNNKVGLWLFLGGPSLFFPPWFGPSQDAKQFKNCPDSGREREKEITPPGKETPTDDSIGHRL